MEHKEGIVKNAKNVTLFLGNGFDLNMGLKTSYEDFVSYYLEKAKSDDTDVNMFKRLLKRDQEKWCDLELQLGKLTSEFKDADSFYKAYCNMGEELLNYLMVQEYKFEQKTELEKRSIAHRFIDDILILLMHYRIDKNVNINILILNYTRIIYKLVSVIAGNKELSDFLKSKHIIINNVVNCHGSYETKKICFGLDNVSQIINQNIFNNRYRLIQQMLKPERNKIINPKTVKTSSDILFGSDIIINYGCSFGATDEYWLNILSRWLGKLPDVINGGNKIIRNERTNNRALWVYSHSKPPRSFFDADTLEFEDKIKGKYTCADDTRIIIKYNNIFESLKDVLK